jgi:hypothetical protein
MAKKAPAKNAPPKRKPRAKKPVDISAEFGQITAVDREKAAAELRKPSPQVIGQLSTTLSSIDAQTLKRLQEILDAKDAVVVPSPRPIAWRSWLTSAVKIVALIGLGVGGGIWSAGGIEVGPKPIVRNDVLQQCYNADRVSQAAILREYATKGFANDTDGRLAATEWFNANRFRNRATDFRPYTTAVVDHFATGTLATFADELEGK